MLLDTLGIIIGFITIVLLLSILVTAIVQTIVSFLRLRHKTLRKGLIESKIKQLLESLTPDPKLEPGPLTAYATKPSNADEGPESVLARRELFERIQKSIEEALSDTDGRATWLEDKQVIEPLKSADVGKTGIALVQHALDEARRKAEDLLLRWSRSITFALSVIVAFAFAASVPDILKRLSSDADFRARAEAVGEGIVHDTPSEYTAIVLGPAGLRARTVFLSKYPDYAVQLGALRFEALAVDDLVANFETAMDAEPQRDELAAEYRALVEKELADEGSKAAEAARRAVGDLASIGLEPIRDFSFYVVRDGAGNYHVHGDRIAGVLFMAVLMSFGAAFWYRILKELVGLKDALRKRDDTTETRVEAKIVATATNETKPPGS